MEETGGKKKVPWLFSCRLGLAVISFLGFVNLYVLRVNISVGIVCMVNYTALDLTSDVTDNVTSLGAGVLGADETCGAGNAVNATESGLEGEFAWDKSTQGLVLGSFYWGYIITQIPGGWLAAKFGGKHVFGWCMLVDAIATLLVPVASRLSVNLLIFLRFLTGLGQGVVWPAMNMMWAFWAPPLERSTLAAFTFAGSQIGNVITLPLSALLCEYGFDGGWPAVFYVWGALGVLWFVAWMGLTADTPEQHPRISPEEKEYIQTSLKGHTEKQADSKASIPWLTFVKSRPVWGAIVCHTCANFGTYIFLTNMPTYMKEVLKFEIKKNGLVSAIPYVFMWIMINVSATVADKLRSRDLITTTTARKLGNTFGCVVPACLFLAMGFMDCTQWKMAVVLLTFGVGFMGCQYGSGFVVNYVDIAPRYSAVLFGISNTFATLPGFLAPVTVAALTPNRSQAEWQGVFYIAFGVYMVGAVAYLLLGSGELQPWAAEQTDQVEQTVKLSQIQPADDENENGKGVNE